MKNTQHDPETCSSLELSKRTDALAAPCRNNRRHFTPEYKSRIVEEANACTKPGQIAKILRREGLYPSNLALWRRQYQAGAGRVFQSSQCHNGNTTLEQCVEELSQENMRLAKMLAQAERIVEIQIQEVRRAYQLTKNQSGLDKNRILMIEHYRKELDVARLCQAFNISRASFYRQRKQVFQESLNGTNEV
jgi:transposase-like protein